MSRFIDAGAGREVDLGPCDCPGTPHERDTATIRSQLSGSEIAVLQATPTGDELAASEAVTPLILSWNLLGPNGEATDPTATLLRLLTAPTLTAISEAISEVVTESTTLPNPSSAPSRASSRGSASRTPKTSQTPGT